MLGWELFATGFHVLFYFSSSCCSMSLFPLPYPKISVKEAKKMPSFIRVKHFRWEYGSVRWESDTRHRQALSHPPLLQGIMLGWSNERRQVMGLQGFLLVFLHLSFF